MIDFNQQDTAPQSASVEHIFEILNDVRAQGLPVSDALDSLAYWYHEAFQKGDIQVEQPSPGAVQAEDGDVPLSEDIWT